MGQLTRTEIVTQGQAEAGTTGKNTRLLEALVLWEASQYKAWPFSFLRKAKANLSLVAGATSVLIGAGEGGVTSLIERIFDPIFITRSGYTMRSTARILTLDNRSTELDERTKDPTSNRGVPLVFKVRTALSTIAPYRACKSLIPSPVPDQNYLLQFDYWELPRTDQTASSSIPAYPNDQTMKKFVEMMAYKWINGPSDAEYQSCRDELAAMVTNDRMRDGQAEGSNQQIGLDPEVYMP